MHFAIDKGNEEEALNLIKPEINIDLEICGRTPLILAIIKEQFEVAYRLVEHGASLNYRDNSPQQMFPIHLASKTGNTHLIQKMIDRHLECINQTAANEVSPLHIAAAFGHFDVVKLLVDNGAEVNAVDKYFHTPLHRAVESNEVEIVDYLLEKNARFSMPNTSGLSALGCGVVLGNLDVIKRLLMAGDNPNFRDRCGQTYLHFCCKAESDMWLMTDRIMFNSIFGSSRRAREKSPQLNLQMASLLIDHGADIFVRDSNNDTPFSLALRQFDADMVTLLLNAGISLKLTNAEERLLADKWAIVPTKPPSLTFVSKFSIRKYLGNHTSQKISTLPLPSNLKEYLTLSPTLLDRCL